jgi:hypothetical protein
MKNFALVNEGVVLDIFVADQAAVLEMMFPDSTIVEATEETGYPFIGGTYENGKFVIAKPFASWVKNNEGTSWVPPVAYPEDGKSYGWNEETVSWEKFPTE